MQGEGAIQDFLLPRPLIYCVSSFKILRHVAQQPFMSPPYNSSEVARLTVHSTKSALISAANQLDLPTHWIAEQGHHPGKRTQGDRYSRDGTVYQLLLQRTVVCKTKLDGDQLHHKLVEDNAHFHRNILFLPTDDLKWPAFLDNSATMTRKQVQTLNHRRRASQNLSYLCWILSPSKSTSKQAASDSDSSSDSPSSSSPEEGNQRQLTGPFILNQVTKIAHLTKTKEGKMLPSCGAKFLMRNCTEYRAKFPKTLIFASIRDVCANDLGKKITVHSFRWPRSTQE